MLISFYGIRSSTPSPAMATVKYGDNTSNALLELSNGERLTLESGICTLTQSGIYHGTNKSLTAAPLSK